MRIGQKDSESEIELTARGFRLATSVGGTLTGRGGDLIIIDDPLKPHHAYSDVKRNAANEWFKNTLISRLDDKRSGAILIVMHRIHLDDLTGFVQSLSDDWTVLSLPAIAEIDEDVPISEGKVYRRKAGEALASEREPLAVLEVLKLQLGSDAFSAQYQQAPAPPGGAMIKRHWVQRHSDLPAQQDRLIVVQSWDTASKGGPENGFSVGTTWCVTRGKHWYLVDVWRNPIRAGPSSGRVRWPIEHWKDLRPKVNLRFEINAIQTAAVMAVQTLAAWSPLCQSSTALSSCCSGVTICAEPRPRICPLGCSRASWPIACRLLTSAMTVMRLSAV